MEEKKIQNPTIFHARFTRERVGKIHLSLYHGKNNRFVRVKLGSESVFWVTLNEPLLRVSFLF